MTRIAPRPQATDYWRWDGEVFRVSSIIRKTSDHRLVSLRAVKGGRDVEVIEFRLREEGELVWTNYWATDETLRDLREYRDALSGLGNLGHAIHVICTDPYLNTLGEIIEDQAKGLQRVLQHAIGIIASAQAQERDVMRRRLNDELGIPNCDHLVSDPTCPECAKEKVS